ncbi:MAG: hypothetical protein JXR07_08910 [Reichenbachiella sp.]
MQSRLYCQKLVLLIFLLFTISKIQSQDKTEDSWQFTLSPYLYLPALNGSILIPFPNEEDRNFELKIEPQDYLEKIKMALMFSAKIQKNRFSIYTDIFYYRLGEEAAFSESTNLKIDNPIPWRPPIEIGVDLDIGSTFNLKSTQYTVLAGYSLREGKSPFTVVSGMRTTHIDITLDWNLDVSINDDEYVISPEGSVSSTMNSWNAVVGAMGAFNLSKSEKLKFIYFLNGGLGTSRFTMEMFSGFSYLFGKRTFVKLIYRHIYYDHKEKSVIDRLAYSGIAVGASIRF